MSMMLLSISGMANEVKEEDLHKIFTDEEYGGAEIRVVKFQNRNAVLSIENCDSKGISRLTVVRHVAKSKVHTTNTMHMVRIISQ